ncbi:MAG: NADH-quinone oxidoreductase subunit L [Gammaproteobacteria bacterium]
MLVAPLIGTLLSGLMAKQLGKRGAHTVTIAGVAIAFLCALYLFTSMVLKGTPAYYGTLYTWIASGEAVFNVGILVDRLSTTMMVVVSFISLVVHVYSIGYMWDDPGYQRFFSFMSLFTFFMLTLVTANNFALLFFGWEGVGLVSYLLIGFWFQKESAAQGSLKAFLVNRVGDLGFILGIAATFNYFGSLDYATVFANAPTLVSTTISLFPHTQWSIITVICLLLFGGAMGKSAQIPLHVWLPESMEGPTPISALIHAATMVTAGVYLVVRLSPMYELSPVALSVVLIIGATGALFMGLIGIVENDIKRVIAYSTMSQLGYMMAAAGASAYAASMFQLFTHAFFKALLFLAAGSVIIAMHHEQNVWKMGNLRKYLPLTYFSFFVGALALSAIPPFAGFYSKDAIIEAVHYSNLPGATYAYICLLIGAFVTALYIFRILFVAFHTQERMDEHLRATLRESSAVVIIPLLILVIPAIFAGMTLAKPLLYEVPGWFGASIYVSSASDTWVLLAANYKNALHYALDSFASVPVWLALAGIATAWLCYVRYPALPGKIRQRFYLIYWILMGKYGFDAFNNVVFVRGARALSGFFYHFADLKLIDDILVNGSGRGITYLSRLLRRIQSGYLYHYVFAMIIGLLVFLGWLLV